MVCQEHRLGALQVGVAGHGEVRVASAAISSQGSARSSTPLISARSAPFVQSRRSVAT